MEINSVTEIATSAIQAVAPSGGYAILAMIMVMSMSAVVLIGAFYMFKYVFGKVIPILEKIDGHLSSQVERDKAFIDTIAYERGVSKDCFDRLSKQIKDLTALNEDILRALEINAIEIKSRLEK